MKCSRQTERKIKDYVRGALALAFVVGLLGLVCYGIYSYPWSMFKWACIVSGIVAVWSFLYWLFEDNVFICSNWK